MDTELGEGLSWSHLCGEKEKCGNASFSNFSLESERTILIFGGGEVSVFGITSVCSNDAVSET
jgi:hypothetical protein